MEDDPLNDTLILTPEERDKILRENAEKLARQKEEDEEKSG